MRKKEFINQLKKELRNYRKLDTEGIIFYYDEMIQDAVDEGANESQFIQDLGSIDMIVANMVNDEDFMIEVRTSNQNSLGKVMHGTVKIFTYFIYYILMFVYAVLSVSVVISGGSMMVQAGVYLITDHLSNMDIGLLLALMAMGLGISFIGIAMFRNMLEKAQSLRLMIARKTKVIFRKKEGNNDE